MVANPVYLRAPGDDDWVLAWPATETGLAKTAFRPGGLITFLRPLFGANGENPRSLANVHVVEIPPKLIFAHSPIVRFAFEHLYPDSVGKINANTISVADLVYSEAEEFGSSRRPFARARRRRGLHCPRLATTAEELRRRSANLAREPGAHGAYRRGRGEPAHAGNPSRRVDAARGRVCPAGPLKAVVCPSSLDAAPGILFKASAMACNVVVSPNCGNCQLCHRQLLAARCAPDAFLERIGYALEAPYAGREQYCSGYADLLETLSVF